MHRCWLALTAPPQHGDIALLSRQEGDHIVKVLRMKAGDPVQLIAAERLYLGEIVSTGADGVQVRFGEELPSSEPVVKVMLVQGLPKADKLEWIVQKATELGISRVVPAEMARSVARITAKGNKKRERLNRIALEAAKQAGRAHVPEILPAMRFSDALQQCGGTVYVAWEEESSLRLSEAVTADKPGEITLIIGPEGGITPDEIRELKALGAKPVTLGKRILRTETAGICALSVIMASLGEM